jgi:hypothetical protein
MRQTIGTGLVVLGVGLMTVGLGGADTSPFGVFRIFTDNPPTQAIWLEGLGVVAILAGLALIMVPPRLVKR